MTFTIEQQKAIAIAKARKRQAEEQLPTDGQNQPPAQDPSLYQQIEQIGPSNLNRGLAGTMDGATAEFAVGGNATIIGFLDMLTKAGTLSAGGYNGIITLLNGGTLEDAAHSVDRMTSLIDNVITSLNDDIGGVRPGQGQYMADGVMQQLVNAGGSVLAPGLMGLTKVPGRDLTKAPGQLAELAGFGSAAPAGRLTAEQARAAFPESSIKAGSADNLPAVIDDAIPTSPAIVDDVPPPPSLTGNKKLDAELSLLRKDGNASAVGFRLDDAGKVVPDKTDKMLMKHGWPRQTVGMLKAANTATRAKIREMMDIVRGGVENSEYKALNRPGTVVGDSMDARMQIIRKANKESGKAIEKVAETQLKGTPIDLSSAVDSFMDRLAKHRITKDPATGKLNYEASSIRGLKDPQSIIDTVVEHLSTTPNRHDAFDAHFTKKFLDEQVTYGKRESGLSGAMARTVKMLRHDIDTILDGKFKDYDAANSVYAETIEILDDMQRLAGGDRIDIQGDTAGKALGLMSRKILSNYGNSTEMQKMAKTIDRVAKKHAVAVGGNLDDISDELVKLVVMEGDIRKTLPGVAQTNTAQGTIESARTAQAGALPDVADGLSGNPLAAARATSKLLKRASGDDTIKQIDALMEWLDAAGRPEIVRPPWPNG